VYSSRLDRATAAFAPETLQQLENYPWPGNIRELENVIHHALLVCDDNLIHPADLHLAPLQSKTSVVRTIATNPLEGILSELFAQNAPHLYESLTETIIRTAYRYCRNNQVQTARLLGISRNILRSHLKHLGLISSSADVIDGRIEAGM
jgi:sigma-54-specific transcriptional regulator